MALLVMKTGRKLPCLINADPAHSAAFLIWSKLDHMLSKVFSNSVLSDSSRAEKE
jgi:hypothetical protein